VTIGRTEKEHGYPTFGNNVYIAPGAVVIGNIDIGDNVKIGPNTVVRRSVPPNSVVMALPPKVIRMTTEEELLQEKVSAETGSSKVAGKGQLRSETGKPREETLPRHRRETAPAQRDTSHQNRNVAGNHEKKDEGGRYKRKHDNWENKYRPRVGVKTKQADNQGRQYQNSSQGTHGSQNPKPRDFADESMRNIRRKNVDTGTSPRKTSDRDKWAEDMEGESLDS
jgi:hypothetical protein